MYVQYVCIYAYMQDWTGIKNQPFTFAQIMAVHESFLHSLQNM